MSYLLQILVYMNIPAIDKLHRYEGLSEGKRIKRGNE